MGKSRRKSADFVLPEDGLIDETAVRLAATQQRIVSLTPGERKVVLQLMVKSGKNLNEMGVALVSHTDVIRAELAELGFEVRRTSGFTFIQPTGTVTGTPTGNGLLGLH